MKRLKQLLVIGLAAVMVFAFAACGKSSKTLSSISVDSSEAKTEYIVGEEFSSDGIVVTAVYSDSSTATISSGSYEVNSSAYSSTTAGTYAITVSYTESSVTKTASYSVTVGAASSNGLSSVRVDTTDATTVFYLNQSFDYTGLKVYATIDGVEVDVTSEINVNLFIDRSAYVASEVGEYKINIFYEYGSASKSTSYTVSVTDQVPMAGLDILVNGTVTYETDLAITGATVTLSTDAVISDVKLHEITYENGTVDTVLTADQYTAKFYSESDVETELTGDALTVSNGTYILVVSYEGYVDPAYDVTYTLTSQLIIHIDNAVTAIAVNTDDSNAVFTQPAGLDKISSTWTYTVTYSNGGTAQVSASDVTVTIDTKTVSESSTATVSYTLDGVTVTCTVPYSITEATGVTYNYSFDYDALVAAISTAGDTFADSMAVKQSYLTDPNDFLTVVDGGTVAVRDGSSDSKKCIEVRNSALEVTFLGTGTITISFASTGGSNTSDIALMDADGNYITATSTTATASTSTTGVYEVAGTTYYTVTYTITAKGTYTIVGGINYGRNTRINSIGMVDET